MRCAPRTQIPRISCYTKSLTVVKGFSKDLVSVRTPQAIRSNGSGYPLEKKTQSIPSKVFERHRLIRLRRIVIRSNSSGYPLEKIVIRSSCSGYPFEENCNPFERLELSRRSKELSAALLFQITFTRAVRDENHVSLINSSKRPLPSSYELSR